MADLSPGSEFAGHRIEGVAGRGGMGTVYRATHIALDHEVALKVISADLAADEAFRERFRSESRIAVSLRHPNVVPVHHAGEEDGLLFVTMDLIDGPDLRRLLISGGTMEPSRAAAILTQVAGALDVAHSRGLVHRDIKPGNVLIEQREGEDPSERAYLTDFGLAKRFDQSGAALTATGGFVGTLDYVAPEQIKGDRVDARTDVYALGCVLYETLAGRPPFGDKTENVSKMYAHLQDEPPWLPGEVHDDLDEVIARALAKEPRDRFPSAGDLARAATAAASGVEGTVVERSVARGSAAPQTPPPTPPVPPVDPTIASDGPDDATELDQATPPGATELDSATPPGATELDAATPPGATELDRATPPPLEPTRQERTPATPARKPPTGKPPPRAPAAPPAGAPHGRRRAGLLLVLAAVAVAAVAAILLLGGGGDDDSSSGGIQGDPIAVRGMPIGVNVHQNPADPEESVVTVAARDGSLTTFSAMTRKQVGETITLPGQGEGVHTGGSFAWISLPQNDAVAKVPLGGDGVPVASGMSSLPVGANPTGIAGYDASIFVANTDDGTITRITPNQGDSVETIELPEGSQPADMAFDEDNDVMWVSDRTGRVIAVPLSGGEPQVTETGGDSNPKGIAVLDGSAWVALTGVGQVARIPIDGGKTESIDVGGMPRGLIADDDTGRDLIWVANGDGYVSKISPDDPQSPTTFDVPGSPEEVAAGPVKIWVTSGEGNELNSIMP